MTSRRQPRMKPNKKLDRLLKEAAAAVKRMTPKQYKRMIDAQRRSWTQQDMD